MKLLILCNIKIHKIEKEHTTLQPFLKCLDIYVVSSCRLGCKVVC